MSLAIVLLKRVSSDSLVCGFSHCKVLGDADALSDFKCFKHVVTKCSSISKTD